MRRRGGEEVALYCTERKKNHIQLKRKQRNKETKQDKIKKEGGDWQTPYRIVFCSMDSM